MLSVATVWEFAVKVKTGKLILAQPFLPYINKAMTRLRIALLPITLAHLDVLTTLPLHHHDPFDRMLIAQAMIEQVPIISFDVAFDAYPITRSW